MKWFLRERGMGSDGATALRNATVGSGLGGASRVIEKARSASACPLLSPPKKTHFYGQHPHHPAARSTEPLEKLPAHARAPNTSSSFLFHFFGTRCLLASSCSCWRSVSRFSRAMRRVLECACRQVPGAATCGTNGALWAVARAGDSQSSVSPLSGHSSILTRPLPPRLPILPTPSNTNEQASRRRAPSRARHR
jgi:hypothetical protein